MLKTSTAQSRAAQILTEDAAQHLAQHVDVGGMVAGGDDAMAAADGRHLPGWRTGGLDYRKMAAIAERTL